MIKDIKQATPETKFFCLDNTVRRLPNYRGKHGMSVFSDEMEHNKSQWLQQWKLQRNKCFFFKIKLTYFEKNEVYLHFYTFFLHIFYLCSRKYFCVRYGTLYPTRKIKKWLYKCFFLCSELDVVCSFHYVFH